MSASEVQPSAELLRRLLAREPRGPRYAPRGEIARGGMGAIHSVWDEDLGRELAMKVVLGSDGSSTKALTPGDDGRRLVRFLEEAQITGQLEHPCVVPVHELGLDAQGHAFFTMRMVRGRDLGRVLELVARAAEGWSEARALGVLLRVCEAVAYAHSKGVIHRDLKPANVMVGSFGEVYVMDWGLARVEGRPDAHDLRLAEDAQRAGVHTSRSAERASGSDSSVMTMDGDVLGTPAYMPPEQARGEIEQLSSRSDVYAIGAMLYELLARRAPYAPAEGTRSGLEVLRAVLEGPPTPLRALREDLPPELEAICEKAMARDPRQRYASTALLGEDLRAFLEGRVVQAYRTGALVELSKWVRRNRALASAAALAVLFLAAGLATSLWQKRVADRNAGLAALKAEEALRESERAEDARALAESREREAAASARRAEAVGGFLTGMLASANPMSSLRRDMPVSAVLDDAAARLDAGEFAEDPHTELALRSTLGEAYQGIHRFEESEHQHRAARALLPRLPDLEPQRALALEVDLADTLVARGSFEEADGILATALRTAEEWSLPQVPWRVRILSLASLARYNLGHTEEACDMVREALALQLESAGEGSETAALLRSRLAFLLAQRNEWTEAVQHLDRALGTLQAGSPKARIEAASALRTRANVWMARRQTEAALADLEQALSLRRELFGDESIPVADLELEISICLGSLGRTGAAVEAVRPALETRRRFLGEHRDTATALAVLGSFLGVQREFEQGRELLEQSLAMRRSVLPEGNAGIGDSLRRLGSLALDAGDFEAAERALREGAANWERSLGPEHPDLCVVWLDLGRVLRRLGRAPEAIPLLERALALRVREHGEMSASGNEVRDELASTYLAAGDFLGAEQLLRSMLELYRKTLAPGRPLIAYTGAQLGAALLGQGRLDEAEPLLLAGWEAIGENPMLWVENKLFVLDRLVDLYQELGQSDEAAAWRAMAEALRR